MLLTDVVTADHDDDSMVEEIEVARMKTVLPNHLEMPQSRRRNELHETTDANESLKTKTKTKKKRNPRRKRLKTRKRERAKNANDDDDLALESLKTLLVNLPMK